MGKKIRIGIGFATGRKNFQRILRSYVYNWKESHLVGNEEISLHLFVAYDLKYRNTKKTDYTRIAADIEDMIEERYFIGSEEAKEIQDELMEKDILNEEECALFFRKGYATQRNIVLYYAMKKKMDYLLFLDDDEYPQAVTHTHEIAIWGGQQVLKNHLNNIKEADITYGYHCGYISPIPYLEFNEVLPEAMFRTFIEAISNDIINWEKIKRVMEQGGVTYADTAVLTEQQVIEVEERDHAKFISGSNLCINLTRPERVFPFYNPPGARGEDTFLSTCLSERRVLRVPCYTFHDGFSSYNHLLSGVLPIQLKFITPESEEIKKRFYHACLGWVRYKPLFLYLTDPDSYEEKIRHMGEALKETLPSICNYFHMDEFNQILKEFDKYQKNVEKHRKEFIEYKQIWEKITTELLTFL
ncbi:MAG: hypothetical protein PWP24_1835 [Clostridiales bacterium]|nr:hypothetical protein [Clostridiales bacterium]